jgi:hypothetical protein
VATKPLNKRRPKAEVLQELDEQAAPGPTVRDRKIAAELELAWA